MSILNNQKYLSINLCFPPLPYKPTSQTEHLFPYPQKPEFISKYRKNTPQPQPLKSYPRIFQSTENVSKFNPIFKNKSTYLNFPTDQGPAQPCRMPQHVFSDQNFHSHKSLPKVAPQPRIKRFHAHRDQYNRTPTLYGSEFDLTKSQTINCAFIQSRTRSPTVELYPSTLMKAVVDRKVTCAVALVSPSTRSADYSERENGGHKLPPNSAHNSEELKYLRMHLFAALISATN